MTSDKTEGTDFTYPEGYAEQIAHAVNNWAYLENNINRAIWALAKTAPALGACITSQIASITGRLNALLALMKTRQVSAKLIKRVNRFCEDIRGPTEFRNRIAHDPWFMTNPRGGLAQLRVTAQKSLTFEIKEIPLESLKEQLKVIAKVRAESTAILVAILAELPSLPDIPQSTLDPITFRLQDPQNPSTETK